jgi:hypothetical protein
MDFEEFQRRAQEARKRNITSQQLSQWGKKSAKVRLAGMTKEEKSEYFRKVRAGIKLGLDKL